MAYINPQLQLDQQQQARNDANYKAIGDSIISGIETNRRRALDYTRNKNTLASDLASKGITATSEDLDKYMEDGVPAEILNPVADRANRKLESDIIVNANKNKQAKYKADQLDLPREERDAYKTSMDVARARNEFVNNRMGLQEANKIEAEQRKMENDRKQKLESAAIPDFEIADPNVIPTSKDSETVKNLNASNKSFQGLGGSVIEKLAKSDPRNPAYYVSNDWKMLQQDLTKMKLQAKNLEDLGVLNGPDLSLVNETLGSINPSSLALLGPEKAAERVKAAMENSQKVLMNAASSRNYRPRQVTPNNSQQMDEKSELEMLRKLKQQKLSGAQR